MSYIYYNANPEGRHTDDCVKRALSKALGYADIKQRGGHYMIGSTNVPGGLSYSQVKAMVDQVDYKINKMNNVQTLTVPASGWTGSSGPYTQSIAITGYEGSDVTAADRPEIFWNTEGVSQADAEAYAEQCSFINKIETGSNVLNLSAYDKPTMDIKIDVKGV